MGLFGKNLKQITITCAGCPLLPSREVLPEDNYSGSLTAPIMFITDRTEHRPLLLQYLNQAGIPKTSYSITSGVLCNTKKNSSREEEHCFGYVSKKIEKQNPVVIVTVGEFVTDRFIKEHWSAEEGGAKRFEDFIIPLRKINSWLIPLILPPKDAARIQSTFYLTALAKIKQYIANRPFESTDKIPNETEQVDVLYSVAEIKKALRYFCVAPYSSFDYETTAAKPHNNQEVYSASISDGDFTISFLMQEKLFPYWVQYLKSKSKKIAHNTFFEHLWSLEIFKTSVKNWHWDTMLASHMANNKMGTKSLEFQAFVWFGIPDYSSDIKKYIKSKYSNEPNKIKEAPPEKILLYGGTDSLVTFNLFQLQREQMIEGT